LIPVWGIVGAGLAALVANLVSGGLIYLMSQKYYPLPYQPFRILLIWLVGGVCVAVSGVFNVVAGPGVTMSLLMAFALMVLFAGIILALRVVTTGEIAALGLALRRAAGNMRD
jgi:hypothetical protein